MVTIFIDKSLLYNNYDDNDDDDDDISSQPYHSDAQH